MKQISLSRNHQIKKTIILKINIKIQHKNNQFEKIKINFFFII
jgi:hypothetical protein